MRPDVVVIVSLQGQLAAGIGQAGEDLFVQAFVAPTAVEQLDVAVPLRLARVDVLPLDAVVVGTIQDRLAGELSDIVRDDAIGFAVNTDQGTQFPRDPCAGDAGVGNQTTFFCGSDRRSPPECGTSGKPQRCPTESPGTSAGSVATAPASVCDCHVPVCGHDSGGPTASSRKQSHGLFSDPPLFSR